MKSCWKKWPAELHTSVRIWAARTRAASVFAHDARKWPLQRKTFQHRSGKDCGKTKKWSGKSFILNWFSILHTSGCWHFGGGFSAEGEGLKIRLDKLLLGRGLVPSRERGHALILAGMVMVNGQKMEKAGAGVDEDAEVRLLGEDLKYVGRGGLKLEKALEHWKIDVAGKVCLDIGASTGGFTDCLLQQGAARVIAVDTGHGQIDFRLRQDPRVQLLEKTNARYLTREQLSAPMDLVAMDVSFISATLVLPAVVAAAFPQGDQRVGKKLVVLVKPQFEAGREMVGKGGIVRDEAAHAAAVDRVRACVMGLGASETDVIESPITGAEGNREFLLLAKF